MWVDRYEWIDMDGWMDDVCMDVDVDVDVDMDGWMEKWIWICMDDG